MVSAKKIHNLIPLGFILALSFFLKIPSLFEPNHYGDEGIYQAMGQVVHRGGLLYRDVWDNKPPFLYFLYAIFDGDQFLIRFACLIFTLLAIVTFYFLAKEIFIKRSKLVFFTTSAFAILISLPLLEGNIANAENFMFFPIILAFYLVYKNLPKIKRFSLLGAGFLFSFAFLFKIVAVFDFAALFLFLNISFWGQKRKQIASSIPLFLGFTLPIFIIALFFLSQGAFKEFLSASFSQNVSYVAWGNEFLIAQGWLLFKLLLLSLFCLFLLLKRKAMEKEQLLAFLWFAFSLFNAFFAQRPWTHYLLVLVPSFCLLLGLAFQSKKFRFLTLALLFSAVYFAGAKFWLYEQTLTYYPNFYSFISGQKTLEEYRVFWGEHVNRDYRIAQFLTAKTNPEEKVFIWANSAQIYALAKRPPSSRFVVAYHMSFTPEAEEETIASLLKTKPRYFVIPLPQSNPLQKLEIVLLENYDLLLKGDGFLIYERHF